jgi:arylsulfatase A-like enzyme
MTQSTRPARARAGRLLLAVAVLLLPNGCQRPRGRPNVILISIDTLRADRLNAYGFNGGVVSRHIDTLAEDGILFERSITASPWTTPAQMSLFTSLNPSAHGITASFRDLREDVRAGRHFITLSQSVVTLAEALAAEGMRTAAFTAGGTVDPRIGFGRGFDSYDTSMMKLGEHNTPAIEGWLARNGQEPFFLFLHTFEVHAPYVRTRFLDEVLPADRAAPLKKAIETLGRSVGTQEVMGPTFRRAHRRFVRLLRRHGAYNAQVCEALYLGGIQHTDQWIGSLMAELKRLGIYDDTLIVLTSDHGEEFSDHGATQFYNTHGHSLYEELVHVPLIIKLPRQRCAGRRESRLTRLIDIMPTVLDLVGVEDPPPDMQGVSLRPLWEEEDSRPPAFAISEALAIPAEKKSIRTDRYKLVVSIGPETVEEAGRDPIPAQPEKLELFDLEADPREKVNLLVDPALPPSLDLAARLENQLRQSLAGRRSVPEETTLDAETLERLQALGYLED